MAVFWRTVIGGGRATGPQAAHLVLEISHIVAVAVFVVCPELASSNGFKLDAMLHQKALVFAHAFGEVRRRLVLFAPARRLRRNDAAFDAGLETVGAWLLFVAPHFSLLAKNARVAAGELLIIRRGTGLRTKWLRADERDGEPGGRGPRRLRVRVEDREGELLVQHWAVRVGHGRRAVSEGLRAGVGGPSAGRDAGDTPRTRRGE